MANTDASKAQQVQQTTMFNTEALENFHYKKKTVTRKQVLEMADCSTAALIIQGALSTWGVTSEAIASGRILIRTTPTKLIVANSSNCPDCPSKISACSQCPDGELIFIDWEEVADELVTKGIA